MLVFCLAALPVSGQETAQENTRLVVVTPFENTSGAPGLDWIGEAFAEVLGERLQNPGLELASREERADAFEHLGVPAHIRPSTATLYRVGETLDADYLVLGRYDFDGESFRATAQVLDLRALTLSSEVSEAGPLVKLIDIQTGLGWKLLQALHTETSMTQQQFVRSFPPVRLDAFENYVRGILATAPAERIRYFRKAVELNPAYGRALLELGKTQMAQKNYEAAARRLGAVSEDDPAAAEARFLLGLAQFYRGDTEASGQAFGFVEQQAGLTQACNNLGVVASRRGSEKAVEWFEKAVAAEPGNSDYHFNLGVALYRQGRRKEAREQLEKATALAPSDSEARSFLEELKRPGNANPGTEAGSARVRLPLERLRTSYDEGAFRRTPQAQARAMERRLSAAEPRVHAEYHLEQGRKLLREKKLEEAEAQFRESILLDPTNSGAHLGLAQVLEERGEVERGRAEARTALRLLPSAEAYVVLARLDLRDNSLSAARANVEEALRLEPDNQAARNLRAEIEQRKAQP